MWWYRVGWGTLGWGIDRMEIAVWILVLAGTISLACSISALLWVTLFSRPGQFRKVADAALEGAKVAHLRCDEMEGLWIAKKTELSAILESVDSVLDSVEKKRRQTASGVARLQVAQDPEPVTREDQMAAWRAKVYGGAA